MEAVLVDSNLLLLLVVGSANREYIRAHKRLSDHYDESDFDILVGLIEMFSEIVTVPHVVTEVFNLSRQIGSPARQQIFAKLHDLVETANEVQVASMTGFRRQESVFLGLTDSILLHLCEENVTLMTADSRLATTAEMAGYSVVRFPSQ